MMGRSNGELTMKRHIINIILILICFTMPCHAADEPRINAEPSRITDETISSDIAAINSMQKRLADVNTNGTPIATYHFAKAQAWIDMAMDEYAMNDRTAVIEDTVRTAQELIVQLEAKNEHITMETPLLPTSKMLRPDLWKKANDWKKHPGFSCGEDLVAQLEVQLVWAGHEDNQLGWRHTKPYLQAAERLAKEAGRKIEACQVPVDSAEKNIASAVDAPEEDEACIEKVCLACPVCPTLPEPAAADVVATASSTPVAAAYDTVPDRIHFKLNRYLISDKSSAVLDRVASIMRSDRNITIELQGHTDERGKQLFNKILSKQRAEVVRTYLVSAGVERSRIAVKAFGKSTPLMHGNDIVSYARNRRVEFVFSGIGSVKVIQQYEDVQMEKAKK